MIGILRVLVKALGHYTQNLGVKIHGLKQLNLSNSMRILFVYTEMREV